MRPDQMPRQPDGELAMLSEELREDVEYMDGAGVAVVAYGAWHTIRSELLRLARENAELRSSIELDERVWVQREETMEGWIARARKAESERDALRKRIDRAVVAYGERMVAPDGNGYTWVGCRVSNECQGKRVALVPLDDAEAKG